jgi:putative addiction module killer protein
MEIRQTDTYRRWEQGLHDGTARAIIAARLLRLQSGLPGDVKSLGRGLYELRIHYGPGYRIYFCYQGDVVVLLLCGGDKRSQPRDLRLARALVQQWGC